MIDTSNRGQSRLARAAAALAIASGALIAAPVADSTQIQRQAIVATAKQQRTTKRHQLLPINFGDFMPLQGWLQASPIFPISRPPTGALAIRRAARKRRNVARNKAHHRHARGRRN